jgi:DNA-directed RNA polymerase subunit RPC12/RpoP
MVKTSVISAEIRFKTIYVCATCGGSAIGDTVTAEIKTETADEFKDEIERAINKQMAHYMPVGWASFYGKHANEYKCPDCKDKS